jgi:hypothetical protein
MEGCRKAAFFMVEAMIDWHNKNENYLLINQ